MKRWLVVPADPKAKFQPILNIARVDSEYTGPHVFECASEQDAARRFFEQTSYAACAVFPWVYSTFEVEVIAKPTAT